MTLTLILTRHAKSSWDDPTMEDVDRTLNDRGREAASAIGHWLARNAYRPDAVLMSSAIRTVETWDRMAAILPDAVTIDSRPALYLASADVLMNALQNQSAPCVMLIAHNPGIGEFANRVLDTAPAHPKFRRYPTAATTIITFDVPSWADITWGVGHAADFIIPSDLTD